MTFPANKSDHAGGMLKPAEATPEWYEGNPRAALGWAKEYMVADLRETADALRQQADFLDMKASLLADILTAALAKERT